MFATGLEGDRLGYHASKVFSIRRCPHKYPGGIEENGNFISSVIASSLVPKNDYVGAGWYIDGLADRTIVNGKKSCLAARAFGAIAISIGCIRDIETAVVRCNACRATKLPRSMIWNRGRFWNMIRICFVETFS
jgi:hypothetical protein